MLARVIDAAARRLLWLLEAVRGPGTGADPARLRAVTALRDTVRHAAPVLHVERADVLAVASRLAGGDRPADLRGAAVGLRWSLGADGEASRPPEAADEVGDWLAGLFALAREEVLAAAIAGLTRLRRLGVVGPVADIDVVAHLTALAPIAAATGLRRVRLESLRNVTQLPDLSALDDLRELSLATMTGLTDLSGAAAPHLEVLRLYGARHLPPEAVLPFVDHPTLRAVDVDLGSVAANRRALELLSLLDVPAPSPDPGP